MPELSPRLRQLVDASRQVEGPSSEDRDRVSRALGRRLAVGAVVAATALGSKEVAGASVAKAGLTAAAGASTVKWVVVSLAVVAGGLGTVGVYHYGSEPAAAVASARPPESPKVVAAPKAPALAPAPPAEPEAPTAEAPTSTPVRAPAPSAARGDNLARELELLRGAQRALDSGAPTEALALLNQYATEFPHGALRHESQAARIIALCGAGQRAAGLKAAAQFLAAEPNSPFARRVHTACGAVDPAPGSSGQE
jgi:hypothetical protein